MGKSTKAAVQWVQNEIKGSLLSQPPKSPFGLFPPRCCPLLLPIYLTPAARWAPRALSYSAAISSQRALSYRAANQPLPQHSCQRGDVLTPHTSAGPLPSEAGCRARLGAQPVATASGITLGSHPGLEGSRQSRDQLCSLRSSEVFMMLFQFFVQFEDISNENTSRNVLHFGAFEDQQRWGYGMVAFPLLLGHPDGQHTSQDTSLPTPSSALLLCPRPNRPDTIQLQLPAKAGIHQSYPKLHQTPVVFTF